MAGRINDEDIQLLRERADIAAVVGDYTALRRAGSRLKGLCPFHDEKTPSFTVDPSRNVFHCFGCDEGGDVYSFLQKIEALSFPEAVERLARISGYSLRYEELSPGQRKALGRRTKLSESLSEAAAFYEAQLAAPDGAPAREYLLGRGLTQADISHFRLGWSPDEWDAMSRHLMAGGFTAEDLKAAGLSTDGQRGPVDRFRGRVMFPIFDASGRDVVAFGGRVLPGVELRTAPRDGTPPKYINSPETEIYKKSRVLYGLNWGRAEVQRRDTVLVVEGYMDVIGLHTAGVRHAVATCGTALTDDHFRQVEKFARRVILALDADEAGFKAAERARELAEAAGIREVGVLPLPADRDPADLAREGAAAVEAALQETKTAVQFQIEYLLRGADVSTPEGQIDAYRRTFPLLARLGDRFLRYTYIRDVVAPAVRLSADRIEGELDRHLATAPAAPSGSPAPTARPAAPPPPEAAPAGPRRPGDVAGSMPRDPQLAMERDVLQMALQHPELLPPEWDDVAESDFRAPLSQQLFRALRSAPTGRLDEILAAMSDDDLRTRVRALALAEPTVDPEAGKVGELVARLRAATLQREIDEIEERMASLAEQLSAEERRALLRRQLDLVQERHALLGQVTARP